MEPYKLKAEIKEFILQKAKEHPELGCRKLTGIIQETFQADISKSTISSVLKSAGLNKVVGRRRIHPKTLPATVSAIQNTHVIAQPKKESDTNALSELSLRGSPPQVDERSSSNPRFIARSDSDEAILKIASLTSFARNDNEASQISEPLPTEPQETQECGIWFLKAAELCLGGIPGAEGVHNLENIKAINPQIFSELVSRSVDALALKFILEDNTFFFLDTAYHTIWSTERIPERLGVGLHKARAYLNECVLSGRQPLVLQAAPGFDTPAPVLFNFIDTFQAEKPNKAIKNIELYSTDNLLIDTFKFASSREKHYFIIGLWPWQYNSRDFGLPIRLLQINDTNNCKKLDIITNFEPDKQSDEVIIGHYLSRWPNLEPGYQDFLDEIGHFIRSPKVQVKTKCPIMTNNGEDLNYEQLLNFWRLILNNYCQRHFFPLSYQNLDFLVLQERFYHLRGAINSVASAFQIKFKLPEDFPYLNDLLYACQRVNEADIRLGDGRKLRFEAKVTLS